MTAEAPAAGVARPPGGLPAVSGHQDALDGVRAVAAFTVLVFHVALNSGFNRSSVPAAWLFNGGQVGVAVFFVLSGLLLYRPWVRALLDGGVRPRTRTYLRKRALRILPAYWALVACVLLTAERDHLDDVRAWGRLLTLTQLYAPGPLWSSGLGPREMGQTWSLAVEAAWYVSLPITAMLLAWFARGRSGSEVDVAARARRLLWGLGAYALISFGYTLFMFVPGYHPIAVAWPPRYLAWFAAGMALSVVAVWARAEPTGPAARFCRTVGECWSTCWLGALCLFVIAASPLTGPSDLSSLDGVWTAEFHILIFGMCALFFIAPVALAPTAHPGPTRVLGNRVMRFLGRISYGVFLWQMVLILGWFDGTDRLFRGALLLDLPILAAATVTAATLSYYLIEKPIQRLSQGRGGASTGR
ncbi:acyltransferase family protein [Actinomadura alba]|uniref:Acyltransferase n=1 Tax=Actinomadura alba TaxID=406431 RepID=A0ABR7LJH4_9ACTN|nr:acyltransferase [Actinomadura alba]MBC6464919.1 acyltransferase [Actinomadura alba]